MADFYWRIQFLSTPTTGNPDVWSYIRSPAPHLRQYVIVVLFRTDISRRSAVFRPCCFDSGFRVSVLLLKPRSSHSFAVNSLRFRIIFAKIRQVLPSLISPFALCCPSCVVVEFHSSHSVHHLVSSFALCCVSPVLLSSFTLATVSPFRRELSSLFSFSFCLLCCCRVSLQPQCQHFRRQVR